MKITIEISYYSFLSNYKIPVREFLEVLKQDEYIAIETGIMSTIIKGEYNHMMSLLTDKIRLFIEKYPSVFVLKISNACDIS
jgi:uncharacterized protein YqgV (UPF0045/DUF77 family)